MSHKAHHQPPGPSVAPAGATETGRGRQQPLTIALPCFGIVIRLYRLEPASSSPSLAGEIISSLHEGDSGSDDDDDYEAVIDGIESLVLAHACAGVDITTPSYIAGIQTAVQAASGRL